MVASAYNMPGPIVRAFTWIISFILLNTPRRQVILFITPILQMMKLRLKEVWSLVQSNTTNSWWGWDLNIICKTLDRMVSHISSRSDVIQIGDF